MAFIWTKMQAEGGESLPKIIERKERERSAGGGVFWWGIGSRLDHEAIRREARKANGTLPVLFSMMLTRPKARDVSPDEVRFWTQYESESGSAIPVPGHTKITSRGDPKKKLHYALVCRSNTALSLGSLPFDPKGYRQFSKKCGEIGRSQVTCVVQDKINEFTCAAPYQIGFSAELVEPWYVTLINWEVRK